MATACRPPALAQEHVDPELTEASRVWALMGSSTTNGAFWAHVGGFAAGVLAALLLMRLARSR